MKKLVEKMVKDLQEKGLCDVVMASLMAKDLQERGFSGLPMQKVIRDFFCQVEVDGKLLYDGVRSDRGWRMASIFLEKP